jgi:hypothetical protein
LLPAASARANGARDFNVKGNMRHGPLDAVDLLKILPGGRQAIDRRGAARITHVPIRRTTNCQLRIICLGRTISPNFRRSGECGGQNQMNFSPELT